MIEAFELAKKELKRADHLIFVSLKYTRTVDVIKNIVLRLISAFDYGFEALLEKVKEDGKITEVPKLSRLRIDGIKKYYGDDKLVQYFIEFYRLMKKIDKATFDRTLEYRRHVTMTAHLNGDKIEITIDIISDYFERANEFLNHVKTLIGEDEEEAE